MYVKRLATVALWVTGMFMTSYANWILFGDKFDTQVTIAVATVTDITAGEVSYRGINISQALIYKAIYLC